MHAFSYASRTTQGARHYQEDMAKIWADGRVSATSTKGLSVSDGHKNAASQVVAVLADGMGGHAGGDLASQMVCDTFLDVFTKNNGGVSECLLQALNDSNEALAKRVKSEPMLSGMGSTLVGVSFGTHGLHWVSVGDSLLLLFRRGEIAHLNEDHSLAPELDRLAAAGKITVEEARQDPRRHMLRSAVTGDDMELIDRSRKALELEVDDYVILASDGLHTLEENEVQRVISAYSNDGTDAVAGALIRAVEAMRDPHQDNATVVVVRVMDEGKLS